MLHVLPVDQAHAHQEFRMVNEKELLDISTGKEGQFVKDPVPYKEICMDRCMQAVLLSTFSGNTAFFIFLHFGPTFMNKVRCNSACCDQKASNLLSPP